MKSLIIDDEPDNVQLLALKLDRPCPQVEVIGQFTDSPSALIAMRTLRPALVFLDIMRLRLIGCSPNALNSGQSNGPAPRQ